MPCTPPAKDTSSSAATPGNPSTRATPWPTEITVPTSRGSIRGE